MHARQIGPLNLGAKPYVRKSMQADLSGLFGDRKL